MVTLSDARLWTDGRYFLQAEAQLDRDAGWSLMRDRLPETPSVEAWLASALARGDIVGVDPLLFPIGTVRRFRSALAKAGVALAAPGHSNLVDAVWGAEQPPPPAAPLMVHPDARAGATVPDKLARIRAAMAGAGAGALVLAACDEVMWAFNVRGGDVECNPVALSYGLVTPDAATLFVDAVKVTPDVRAHLDAAGVAVAPYDSALAAVAAAPGRVWLDASAASFAVYEAAMGARPAAEADARVLERMSPVQLLKAVKNGAELEGA